MRAATHDETVALCRLCWQAGHDGAHMPTQIKDQVDEDAYDLLRMHSCLGAEGMPFDAEDVAS